MDWKKVDTVAFDPPITGLDRVTKVLRTPDEAFDNIPDFPYSPKYVSSHIHGDIRIAYVDEGCPDAQETILLMHGEPSWSFLYRHMIPPLLAAGYRVVAPDLPGFGRSDKPAKRSDYSYERMVDWITEWLVTVGLDNISLFAQDWGGLIGLRVVARLPERFRRICLANTGLPTGGDPGQVPKAFKVWASVLSQSLPDWKALMQKSTVRTLSSAELDAYAAPFPSEEFMTGSRVLPQLVPTCQEHLSVEENKGAWRRVFFRWDKPLLTLFSDSDPVTRGGEAIWQRKVPGAVGQPHEIIRGAGHFLQEDKGPEIAAKLIRFVADTQWCSAGSATSRISRL